MKRLIVIAVLLIASTVWAGWVWIPEDNMTPWNTPPEIITQYPETRQNTYLNGYCPVCGTKAEIDNWDRLYMNNHWGHTITCKKCRTIYFVED